MPTFIEVFGKTRSVTPESGNYSSLLTGLLVLRSLAGERLRGTSQIHEAPRSEGSSWTSTRQSSCSGDVVLAQQEVLLQAHSDSLAISRTSW